MEDLRKSILIRYYYRKAIYDKLFEEQIKQLNFTDIKKVYHIMNDHNDRERLYKYKTSNSVIKSTHVITFQNNKKKLHTITLYDNNVYYNENYQEDEINSQYYGERGAIGTCCGKDDTDYVKKLCDENYVRTFKGNLLMDDIEKLIMEYI